MPLSPRAAAAPYTVFGALQRRYIIYLVGFLTLASTLTANIYLPLIYDLAAHYHTSIHDIYLTMTVYIIVQALAPSLFCPVSDTYGRRPAFLATLLIYTAASAALALSYPAGSYAVLTALRALQSMGGSAATSLAFSVASDLAPRATRGTLIGPVQAWNSLGPCLGPALGGLIVWGTGEPLWCFVALAVFGAVAVLLVGWTLPETARAVVGDGSIAARGWWRTWWCVPTARGAAAADDAKAKTQEDGRDACVEPVHTKALRDLSDSDSDAEPEPEAPPRPAHDMHAAVTGRGTFVSPRPWASLTVLCHADTVLVLWVAGAAYALGYTVNSAVPLLLADYGLSPLAASLCFLPGGAGVIAGSLLAGRLMDHNWRRVAETRGLPTAAAQGDPDADFPVEEARTRFALAWLLALTGLVALLGWAVHARAPLAATLALLALVGALQAVTYQAFQGYAVDLFPRAAGRAVAANNMVKCALSAAMMAVLQPLLDRLGAGCFFTALALAHGGLSMAMVLALQRWGPRWRRAREGKA